MLHGAPKGGHNELLAVARLRCPGGSFLHPQKGLLHPSILPCSGSSSLAAAAVTPGQVQSCQQHNSSQLGVQSYAQGVAVGTQPAQGTPLPAAWLGAVVSDFMTVYSALFRQTQLAAALGANLALAAVVVLPAAVLASFVTVRGGSTAALAGCEVEVKLSRAISLTHVGRAHDDRGGQLVGIGGLVAARSRDGALQAAQLGLQAGLDALGREGAVDVATLHASGVETVRKRGSRLLCLRSRGGP